MSLTLHTCISIRGMLHTYTAKDWRLFARYCTNDDGTKATPYEAKESVLDLLSKGHEYIPIGEPCEGFSPKTGCPGHRKPEAPNE